eukprot:5590666-Heterocapsa_arctica.AAC.1
MASEAAQERWQEDKWTAHAHHYEDFNMIWDHGPQPRTRRQVTQGLIDTAWEESFHYIRHWQELSRPEPQRRQRAALGNTFNVRVLGHTLWGSLGFGGVTVGASAPPPLATCQWPLYQAPPVLDDV